MSLEAAFEVGRLFLPLKTIADQLSLAQKDLFIRLPALRAYWPMSIAKSASSIADHSGASVHLLKTGSPTLDFDGNAYVQLGVATDFLYSSLGGFEFTGTESWVGSSIRGLTVGGWFKIDATPGTNSGLISKDAPSVQRGFTLYWTTTDNPSFFLSGDGSAGVGISYSPLPLNTWHFIVGRFTPSTEIAVLVNNDKVTNTTSIPAAINVSTQNFEIGRYYNDNNRIIEGKTRDVFICAAALSDATLSDLYQASLPA